MMVTYQLPPQPARFYSRPLPVQARRLKEREPVEGNDEEVLFFIDAGSWEVTYEGGKVYILPDNEFRARFTPTGDDALRMWDMKIEE